MQDQENVPQYKDKYYLSYILFYALGVVTQIPSHFFTTATDYWMYKFRDVNSTEPYNQDEKTSLQAEFTSTYTIISSVAYIVAVVVTSRKLRNKITIVHRFIGCLCGALLLFLLTCIFVNVDTDPWQRKFYTLTLIIGFLLTGFCATFMVTLYEAAVKFPEGYLPPIFSGQAVGGIFAALAQILALGVGGGASATGLTYFLIGLLFVFFSLLAFLTMLQQSDFFKYYLNKKSENRMKLALDKSELKETIFSAISKAKFYIISMVITLACTVMLHPGVITLVDSVNKGNGNDWNDIYFGPVVNFLFYFLFDYVGREAAMFIQKPTNGIILLALSTLRIALVPLILFCNATPRSHLSVTFDDDGIYIFFLILFAFSNGFLINLSIVRVPQVTNEKERPFAMLIVLLLMILSLAICSPISSALVKAL